MNTISPINMNSKMYGSRKVAFENDNVESVGQQGKDTFTPSFKGYTKSLNENGLKKILMVASAFFTGLFAAKQVAANQVDAKSKIKQVKKKEMTREEVKRRFEADYKKAEEINPYLAHDLKDVVRVRDRGHYDHRDYIYNDTMILRIVEENEKDPKMALRLAKFLDHDSDSSFIDPDDIDLLVEHFKTDPEKAESFKGEDSTADITASKITVYYADPELYQYAKDKKWGIRNLKTIYELKQENPEVINDLISMNFTPDQIKKYASHWSKNKNAIIKIDKIAEEYELTNRDAIIKVAEMYKDDPQKIERTVRKFATIHPVAVNALKDITAEKAKTYFYECYNGYSDFEEKHKNYIVNSIKYEQIFDPLTKDIEDNKDRYELKKEIMDKLGESMDKVLPRIMEDGRIPQTKEELFLLTELYDRYPNIEITDRMVELNKDSKLRHYDISRL
ncbi:hypothetical protein IKQ21_02890 [bacterium]|nr:hypothetical protein [bacterium]